jgi:hypothetical protein
MYAGWVGLFLGYYILNLYDILEMTAKTFIKYCKY